MHREYARRPPWSGPERAPPSRKGELARCLEDDRADALGSRYFVERRAGAEGAATAGQPEQTPAAAQAESAVDEAADALNELAKEHRANRVVFDAVAALHRGVEGSVYERVESVLRGHARCVRVRVVTARAPGDQVFVERAHGGDPRAAIDRVVPIEFAPWLLGGIELASPPGPAERDVLDAVLPYVRMALEREVLSLAWGREAPKGRGDFAALAEQWRLTVRQRETLRHVVSGMANKEAAAAMGCGVPNIEFLVKQVLRKSGCASRAVLIARCWST